MDIFIGGVRDRNTALHGDVVAALINPQDMWKVLYPQLDAFLEEHKDLKALVYKPIESIISDSDNASSSSLSEVHNTNVTSHITNTRDMNFETNCDVVVEEDNDNNANSDVVIEEDSDKSNNCGEHQDNKRKKNRRRKKKGRKNVIEVLKNSFALCEESNNDSANIILCEKTDNDSVDIVSCPSKCEVDSLSQEDDTTPSNVIIVPPDQLDGCDLSDQSDASVNSLNLEFQDNLKFHTKKFSKSNDKRFKKGIKNNSEAFKENTPSLSLSELPSCTSFQEGSDNSNVTTNKGSVNESKRKSTSEYSNIKSNSTSVSSTSQKSFKKMDVSERQTKSKFGLKNDKSLHQESKITLTQIMRLKDWQKFVQRTATVARIMERKHSMLAAGILKNFPDKNPHMAFFAPFDNRIPRMKILRKNCPENFWVRPKDYANLILLAKIVEFNDPKYAFGELCRDIGRVGDVEAETESLLLENSIDFEEFPDSILKDLPILPWIIPEEEIAKRTDLRKSVIFTIDPATARDLDDAVSCLKLPNGNFRVGVHIADVSYFLKDDSELDKVAASRANSVYLVQKVIPMLPRTLCEQLCSLNPGEDRLAFSVIWELSPDGTILGEWFGRTVIRSCVKLSYEHAQTIIENPDESHNPEQFPEIFGGVPLIKIVSIILSLHKIALQLREKRVQNGALRLDQVKVGFSWDLESKTPNGIITQQIRESNRLIEEFMLLANISVAQKINTAFPNLALLRKHPPPHEVGIENALKFLHLHNIHLDASTSKSLNASIQNYCGEDQFSEARMQLIVNLCSKPMQYARYYCAGFATDVKDRYHYALNIPCYTHFTSPIRRYPDVIVHRLLAAAIDSAQNPLPSLTSIQIEKIADHCNTRKQASKIVQEASNDMYISLFVRNAGEMVESGMVIGVLDRSVDVLLLRLGIIKRCYMERLPLNKFFNVQEDNRSVIYIEWKDEPAENLNSLTQKLTYFDSVTVILRPFDNDALKVNAFLVRPGK